jgi:hypothetical protein
LLLFFKKGNCPGRRPQVRPAAGRPAFLKKEAKNFCLIGFGLSAEAQPEFVKVFLVLFSKKNRFLCRLPSVEPISIPGQLPKKKTFLPYFPFDPRP